jgi:GTP cyclohydrolase II
MEAEGIEVAERVPLRAKESADNLRYLSAKRARLGHLLTSAG